MIVYGIKNCDTCRKALKWLKEEGMDPQFHDFRKDGLDQNTIRTWLTEIGPVLLINKRGTTYRNLTDGQKAELEKDDPSGLLTEMPTLIKRPIIDFKGSYTVGFSEKEKVALKKKATD